MSLRRRRRLLRFDHRLPGRSRLPALAVATHGGGRAGAVLEAEVIVLSALSRSPLRSSIPYPPYFHTIHSRAQIRCYQLESGFAWYPNQHFILISLEVFYRKYL